MIPQLLNLTEGKMAVKISRTIITEFLSTGKKIATTEFDVSPIFNEHRGVFVTLNKKNELRGCIGRPYPDTQLLDAIIDSAISAATNDPRFPVVRLIELDEILIEVTILTPPILIEGNEDDIMSSIIIGEHGLIIKKGFNQGLLLPQVATEHGFDVYDFLSNTCLKAGLPPSQWKDKNTQIYKFEGQIFKEKSPGGEVIEKHLE
ncbi:TIGR00296 family protein [Methanosalsum natronophilum]|uniref:TIGR00296 family protein n=1 Tax=Methanosalsum natronophilum TaxID=768733 RepID=UPI00216869E1|nr:TIGR00296 family protein [Methanosalsum natronophilum]MCS3924153.1 uncharacterized protein (TIGR00296 family) [Methanosalsum natronophilum]